MKEWNVRLKLTLGDTVVEATITVRAADQHDAVAAGIASAVGEAKIMSVKEAR